MKRILTAVVVILSLSAGAAWAEAPAAGKGKAAREARRQELLAKLPKEKADLFKNAVAAQKVKSNEIAEKVKSIRKEMKAILLAENFNKDEYLKKAAELTKLEADKHTGRSEAVAELATKFTPSERKMLIGAFYDKASRKNKQDKTS